MNNFIIKLLFKLIYKIIVLLKNKFEIINNIYKFIMLI